MQKHLFFLILTMIFRINAFTQTLTLTPVSDIACFGVCDGKVMADASGGVPPYSYYWSNGVTITTITHLCAGTYTCTVTDNNQNFSSASITIYQPAPLTITLNCLNFPSCSQSNGKLMVSAMGGVGAYSYEWSNGQNVTSNNFLPAGIYSCTATDANACKNSQSLYLPDSCDLVWSGDANDDLISDNLDILAIGIGNGTTGTTRINSSTNWTGQPSQNWSQTLAAGSNYKHIDCDGNGTIDLNDTLAVIQHFNLTRPFSKQAEASSYTSGVPDIFLKPLSNTIAPGVPSKFDIMLGDINNQLTNVYGIAFTINYNTTIIDTTSIHLSGNGSWMGNQNNNLIAVALKANGNSELQIAITRTDHNNISGYGKIGEISYESFANILAIKQTTLTISNIHLINYSVNPVPVNAQSTTVVVDPAALVIDSYGASYFTMYPNPAKNQLQIKMPEASSYSIQLYDCIGRLVNSQSFSGKNYTMNICSFKGGIYTIKIVRNNNLMGVQKLIIE